MDVLVKNIPKMEDFLRHRDLHSFCRPGDANYPYLPVISTVTRQSVRAQAAIFNTFDDLEKPIASRIHEHIPRTYTIGLIHAHLKSRFMEDKSEGLILSGSFWAEDRSCIDWLDAQALRYVIYVSFGSIAIVTRKQLLEFWHGLVNSKQRFLWVMMPDSISGKDENDQLPKELKEGAKERGRLVECAPQEEVLNHPAVGGFLTHSGWNSTIESIVAGVPMICWPYFGDQTINSRFVSDVWKIGLDIKDTCDRSIIQIDM